MMKKLLLAFALGLSLTSVAQVFSVTSIDQVPLPQGVTKVAAISPNGDYVLATTGINKGLTQVDLATGQSRVLTAAAGAGYGVRISPDGQTVLYRENSFTNDHLRLTSLNQINLAAGTKMQLLEPTHDLQGYGVSNTTAVLVDRGKSKARQLGQSKKEKLPVLSVAKGQLMITLNGKTKVFSPSGTQHSYLWPSLSPDGKKVLYYIAAHGAYVCDINGDHVQKVGTMRAPVWYDNQTIVGMLDTDDGEAVISSSLVAVTLSGATQTLTDASLIAMYPQTAQGKIAFSTPAGEAYIINVTK